MDITKVQITIGGKSNMADKVGLAYLEKLVGRAVTVYKGGPDAGMGVLEVVREDYLVLKTEDKGYVYYPFTHLKRVVDNSKTATTMTMDESSEESTSPDFPETFMEMIKSLQRKPVLVNGGKHPHDQGYLIDAQSEFIAYHSEKDGLVFYRMDHIRSLSALEVEEEEDETLSNVEFSGQHSFVDVLGVHLHKWTSINGGPDKVEGVLVEVTDSLTILVKNEEIIYVTNDSIHFIKQKVHRKEEKNEQSNDNNSTQTSENSNQSTENNNESKETNKQETVTSTQTSENNRSATIKRMIIESLARNSAVRN